MRKTLLLIVAALLGVVTTQAIPARPGATRVTLPDGTSLAIRLHGDEFMHFNTTDDGYSVVQRADGFYVYAEKGADGQLHATDRLAHDEAARSAEEQAWLSGVRRYQAPELTPRMAQMKSRELDDRARARALVRNNLYDYNNFKGLVLLVEYNDLEFTRPDYAEIFYDIANKADYRGYDETANGRYTGSVRDYFYDNSFGKFAPTFDVVGPIKIDYSMYHAQGTSNAYELTVAALEAADSLIDYSQYDRDHDGVVDMVYFIFAGVGSNVSGNDSRLIWPHKSTVMQPSGRYWSYVWKDGVRFGTYACSTELAGSASRAIIDGIGVICHEFGHVLGLPDLYDTDYESGGGQSNHPDDWTIMAGGGYQNNGRTPSGYTLYERYSLGFATPELITDLGTLSLPSIGSSNIGYRLNTSVDKEFFLLENRQTSDKWDAYLPGRGMLVFRVDSTNTRVWTGNSVNRDPAHNYFELVRAGVNTSGQARSSDPFPGSTSKHELNNVTQPGNLLTWSGQPSELGFSNITQWRDGSVSFDVIDVNVLTAITAPATLVVGLGMTTQIVPTRIPEFAPYELEWTSSNPDVVTVTDGYVTGVSTGEADIKVVANGSEELSAVCHVTVKDFPRAADIAAFRALSADDEAVLMLNDAQVVFHYGSNYYVRDASGAVVFADLGYSFNVGDVLNGYIYGRRSVSSEVPQLSRVDMMTTDANLSVTGTQAVTPREVALADVGSQHYGDLVVVKSVALSKAGGMWAVDGDRTLRLTNPFGLKSSVIVPKVIDGLYFNVTGICQTDVVDGETVPAVGLTGKIVTGEAPSGIVLPTAGELSPADRAVVYTADGRVAAQTTVGQLGTLPLRHGLYIVKAGNSAWRMAR